jgi:hypothetical protein
MNQRNDKRINTLFFLAYVQIILGKNMKYMTLWRKLEDPKAIPHEESTNDPTKFLPPFLPSLSLPLHFFLLSLDREDLPTSLLPVL